MNEVAEDTLRETMTQFLSELEFAHSEPQSWENDKGGREFVITAHRSYDNGLFRISVEGNEQAKHVIFYSTWDIHVPPRKRQEVCELITRLNYDLWIGNLELDFRDGEVRYKSILAYEGIPLNFANLRTHFYMCLTMMNRCAPWIESVIISEHNPTEAAALAWPAIAGAK